MAQDLSFLLMVDGHISMEEIIAFIKADLPGVVQTRHRSLENPENWLELNENGDFDSDQASMPDEGYLYFRYQLEVTPKRGMTDEVKQRSFAATLRSLLRQKGLRVELCSSFFE